ncbi:MAG: antitoxin [Acidobacteria bacterium]|nr:MAG: antitoxin [Acidobacteriota bacterium]
MKSNLTAQERQLLKEVEAGKWQPVKLSPAARNRYVQAARDSLRKDCRLNIRISRADLKAIQKRAVDEGLPYQTLIASLIHKYAAGRLRSE